MSIHLKNIRKSFGDTEVLKGIDLEIRSGELFFLLGPSGCGKSTLLRSIAGLESPSAGSIFLGDREITNVPTHERGIGMVFQQYALWPHMTVFENVAFGLKSARIPPKEVSRRVEEVLHQVRLEGFAERFPSELSGGQQQRVALARALAPNPPVILLDEPLSNLDARLRESIRRELAEIHKNLGITMVYVTHDQEDALALATRVAIMQRGEIEQCGTPEELYRAPRNTFVAGFMGETNLIPCSVISKSEVEVLDHRLPAPESARHISISPVTSVLAIRPENIQISVVGVDIPERVAYSNEPSGNQARAHLLGKIRSVTYRGAWRDVEVILTPHESAAVSASNTESPRTPTPIYVIAKTSSSELRAHGSVTEDSPVVISWAPEDSVLLPAS
jgi:ABC-type Fe3+/spermidine/putrescine transport system ATPase subunit